MVLQRVRHDQAHTYDRLLPLFLESKLWVVYIFNKVDKFSYLDVSYVSYLDEINNVWLQVRKNIIKKLFFKFSKNNFWLLTILIAANACSDSNFVRYYFKCCSIITHLFLQLSKVNINSLIFTCKETEVQRSQEIFTRS